MRDVVVLGVGMHRFGRFPEEDLASLGRHACLAALKDSGLSWKDVQAAFTGCFAGGVIPGNRVMAQLGATGISMVNIDNACASGGTCLRIGYQAVAAGFYDIVLVLGVEKMPKGFIDLGEGFPKWERLGGLAISVLPMALLTRKHMETYGTTREQLAKVSVKNHKNGAHFPYAMYQKAMTLEEVLNSPMVCDPLTVYQLCAPNEGAAAAVLVSEEVARRYATKMVRIVAAVHKTPYYRSAKREAPDVTTTTAREAYEQSGVGPEDLDVVELQDTNTGEEIENSERLGLCPPGEGGRLIDEGITEIGGRVAVNTSGGLLSKGEPVGASGMGQLCELVWQLRGDAGPRQQPDAKVGLGHCQGLGGNCAVVIVKR